MTYIHYLRIACVPCIIIGLIGLEYFSHPIGWIIIVFSLSILVGARGIEASIRLYSQGKYSSLIFELFALGISFAVIVLMAWKLSRT